MPYTEDMQELRAIYVKFDECQCTDFYANDDIFSWYDGVTHVSKATWDEYQRLRSRVASIEEKLIGTMHYYTAEEGVRDQKQWGEEGSG